MIKFGPSGNPDQFYDDGFKASTSMPLWVKNQGLDAYEYQCSKGVKISQATAENLGDEADKNGIYLSVHAPYFISLSSVEEEKRLKSVNYIMQTMAAAKFMGAKRIVVHSGSCSKMSREEALAWATDTLKIAKEEIKNGGFEDIALCPETMGKINQLGTVEEVVELCKISENFVPCIDFGHVNAREVGSLNEYKDFERIVNVMENELGAERAKKFHVHFTRIEYTTGGEKKHIPYDDESFGPCFDPFAELIVKKDLSPVIICESPGMQAKDALTYKRIYEEIKDRK